jgi:Kef-type K+ transport system membrane component KefB
MEFLIEKLVHEFQTPFSNSVLIFSVILFIILLVPLIFNRFKIPGIIGLIVSGTVIGPHGLDLIKRNSAVDLFSTIGLLYIMFLAGLELDIAEFKKHKNKSMVFGMLTFSIPLLIGFPACFYLLGYGLSTSLLTASMFATHTLISYPIVHRLGIAKRQPVAVAVGGTILTDTAVLLLLALIAGSKQSGLTNEFWIGLLISISIFAAVLTFIIPRISSWFFRRLEDEKYAHFIYVLSVIFFCAFLAELSGLEPIIGAFAAGLVLNRLIPHTSSLMNRLEFVGNALFIPFFLISVGMLIDISVLTKGPQAIVVAIVLTLVAICSKWLAAYLTGLSFNYSRNETNLIFGLSTAHAAATLAVILVGYNIGLIDDNILNGTVVLILITCVVASFVTEKSGKKLILEIDAEPPLVVGDQRILVPISNPETMERLMDFAIMIKQKADHSPIVGLTVVKDDDQVQMKLLQSKKLLDKVIVHAAAVDQKVDIMATIDRNVTSGILRIIKEKFITDIVLGWSPGKNLADIIFGQTFDILVKRTSENIFITRFLLPLNVQRNLILICPVFAEKEPGFYKWLITVLNLSRQLRVSISMYGTPEAVKHIKEYIRLYKLPVGINHKGYLDLSEIANLQGINQFDMIMIVSSREGGISYSEILNVLPKKLSTAFPKNNLIFIYPETETSNLLSSYEEEFGGGLLRKGMSYLQQVKRVFKNRG